MIASKRDALDKLLHQLELGRSSVILLGPGDVRRVRLLRSQIRDDGWQGGSPVGLVVCVRVLRDVHCLDGLLAGAVVAHLEGATWRDELHVGVVLGLDTEYRGEEGVCGVAHVSHIRDRQTFGLPHHLGRVRLARLPRSNGGRLQVVRAQEISDLVHRHRSVPHACLVLYATRRAGRQF